LKYENLENHIGYGNNGSLIAAQCSPFKVLDAITLKSPPKLNSWHNFKTIRL